MTFNLVIPQRSGASLMLTLDIGDQIFVLGANGTGKSSLMHRLYTAHRGQARHVSAHRQNWFLSSQLTLSSQQKRQTETNISQADVQPHARWRDDYSALRAGIALYELVDAENIRARAIAAAFDADDLELARARAAKDAPLTQINDLLRAANIPIRIEIRAGDFVQAVRADGAEYGASELSDGERNALLVAANALTARPGTLILIDEPERHLHRSIISPFLTHLFASRQDCAFIVSTHEVMLPVDAPASRTLLLRGCTYSGTIAATWDIDLLLPGIEVDDDLKRDILGARRTILFVEGGPASLDKPLYALLFPNATVITKHSCRDVEYAVVGIRAGESLHWLRPFGIVDNDGRTEEDVTRLAQSGVYALPVFSVESIYYHPTVQKLVAERHFAVVGGDITDALRRAADSTIDAILPHAKRLCERVAEKAAREELFRHLPGQRDIAAQIPITITIDIAQIATKEQTRLQAAIDGRDVATLVARYPVRETGALNAVARCLGFQGRPQYEAAVLKMLIDSAAARASVRRLFGNLAGQIDAE